MKSKKILIWHDSNGKRVRVVFDNRKLISGLLNAIDNDNLQRENLAYVIAQILRSLSSGSKKVGFENEELEDKKPKNAQVPFSQDIVLQTRNLEKGLNNIYNEESLNYPEALNPFTPALSKIRLNKNENAVLAKFLDAVMRAESLDELNKIVDTALSKLKRINAPNKGLWSFADAVLFRIMDTFPEEARDIMHKLILRGATFDDDLLQVDERINKTYKQLQQELQPQLYNQLTKLREVAESAAIGGTIKDVEFDHRTFYMEFSKESVVDVKKVINGTKKLGFDSGNLKLGGDIVKIGESEVEIKTEEDGKVNYLDLSDNSSIKITFHTNRGDLDVNLFHDPKNHDKVQVRVNDPKLWEEFKTEDVVKNCLLGGVPIEKAVKNGNFTRCGKLSSTEVKEKVKKICSGLELSNYSEEGKTPWVDKLLQGKKTTPLAR